MVEMAANGTSFVKVQRNLHGFTAILTSAACEWFLIFLLLIDAVLSYLLKKFAHYCDLQLPCILCSRLDHVLGNEKPGFYRDLLCSNHRLEISSLITCHIHGRLADGRSMCEGCLLSFTSNNKSNPDMHKLFFGKLGFDVGSCGLQSSFLNRDFIPVPMGMRSCSCCNMSWRSRTNVQRLIQLPPPGNAVTKPNIPLPRRLGRRDSLKKIRDKFSGPATSRRLGKSGFDPLSHVGYTKLKITSDSESELPFSDDDDGSSVVRDINESAVRRASEIPPKTLPSDVAPAKSTHHSFNAGPLLIDQCMQPDVSKPHDVKYLAPDFASGHDLVQLNWQQVDQKTFSSALPELISLDDITPPSNAVETPFGVSLHNSASVLSELISLVDIPPPSDVAEAPNGAPSDKLDTTGTSDIGHVQNSKHDEILKSVSTIAEAGIKTDRVVSDPAPIEPTYGDPCDVCNSAKEKKEFGFVAEQPTVKEHAGVNEDLKLLLAEDTLAQGIHSSLSNASLSVQGHGDGLQITGSVLIEGTGYGGLDPLDGSSVSEIEGENIVDRLKRQVEYDQRCMTDLYKELEEERSASAVAANQAMAMITRLQEEKAALHMEALQYLRMMEEQAEYDVEALEKANDLLAEKEKEIQDLEAELEYYRLKFPDESMVETLPEKNFDFEEKVAVKDTTVSCIKNDTNVSSKTKFSNVSEGSDEPVVLSSWSEFEAEKLYISQRLKGLERKLCQFSHHGMLPDMSDSGDSEEAADGEHNQGEFSDDEDTQRNLQMGENGFQMQKNLPVSNGIYPAREWLNASIGEDQIISKKNNHMVPNGQKNSLQCREIDLVSLENEISDLNDRLEVLEADCNFLKHSFNSLQSGNEGMQFLQEITHQLQELRNIGIRSRCRSVP